MNQIHSSPLLSESIKPPEFRPPRTFMAVALIPTVLFHLVWWNCFSPPFDFLLFLSTILLCFPLDYIAIKIIWKSTKRVEEAAFWWFTYCAQATYVLVSADFLLARRLDILEVSPKIKIPAMALVVVLSFILFVAGIGGMCELNVRAEAQDRWEDALQGSREALLLREQTTERRKQFRKENKKRAKREKEARKEVDVEDEDEEEDLRVYIS